jgi:hypothetical protein
MCFEAQDIYYYILYISIFYALFMCALFAIIGFARKIKNITFSLQIPHSTLCFTDCKLTKATPCLGTPSAVMCCGWRAAQGRGFCENVGDDVVTETNCYIRQVRMLM